MEKIAEAGLFKAPVGDEPNHFEQKPHREDEIYVVTAGRARLVTDSGTTDVGPGDTVYVPAMENHTFTDITEDLALLVFFAPPYSGRP